MSQYDLDNYTVLMNFNGTANVQEHLVNLNGASSQNVGMYFTSKGDGSVRILSENNAIGFFPIEQFSGFMDTIRQLTSAGGVQVIIDERSTSIRVGSKGPLK